MVDRMMAAFRRTRAPDGLFGMPNAEPMTLRRELAGLAFVTILVSVVFLGSFWDPVFTGDLDGLLARGDSHLLNAPKGYFLDARLRNGEFPLWDPMQLEGTPYAAHPLAMAFSPPNLIRAVLVRAETAETYFYSLYGLLFFYFQLTGWGMYLLCRRAGVSMLGGLIGAITVISSERWVFNGIYQFPLVCTVAWTPLIFYLLWEAIGSGPGRRRAGLALLAGILYGFQILGGWTQAAIYATLAYVAFVMLLLPATDLDRSAWGRSVARTAVWVVVTCACFGIAGALISSALILPAQEFIGESARSTEHLKDYDYSNVMMNLPSWVRFDTLMNAADPGWVPQGRAFAEGLQYSFSMPLGAFVLAFASLFLISYYRVFVFVAITYVVFDLSFGPPLPLSALMDAYAPFAISTPGYQAALVSVPVGVLTGFGLDKTLFHGRTGPLPRTLAMVLVGVGVVAVVFAVEPYRTMADNDVSDSTWTFLRSLAPAAVIALVVCGRSLRYWPALVFVALCAEATYCAGVTVSGVTNKVGIWQKPFAGDWNDIVSKPDDRLRRDRVTCTSCNGHVWGMESAINGYDPIVLRSALDALSSPGIEKEYRRGAEMGGNLRELTLLRRPFWLAPVVARGGLLEKTSPYPPGGVVFLDSDVATGLPEVRVEDVPRGVVAHPSVEQELWRAGRDSARAVSGGAGIQLDDVPIGPSNSALRVYYTSDRERVELQVVARGSSELKVLSTGRMNLGIGSDGSGVIEVPLPNFETLRINVRLIREEGETEGAIHRVTLVEDLADEGGLIEVRDSLANQVTVGLSDLPGARALVFTEMNYPGWKATLDGVPAPILNANGPYKAVIVPAGTHEVVFMFRPWRVYAGVAISVTALVAALGASMYLLLRRRRPDAEASPAVDTPPVV